MKKLLSLIIAAVMLIVALPAVYGADDITVNLDGRKLEFDVQPQIINDRTMVPMRAIFEALGADVLWDDSTKTVTAEKDGTEIIMNIGYDMMFVNYIPITLDAPPQIMEGRTLVPARAVAESFDCNVTWDSSANAVIITSALQPDATPEPEDLPGIFPFEYDANSELNSNSVGNFKITHFEKQADGNYKINYYLQTYQDGSGKQAVVFECLDDSGKVIGGFGELFYNDAYNWTDQSGSAVIPGRTVKIRLSENNQK